MLALVPTSSNIKMDGDPAAQKSFSTPSVAFFAPESASIRQDLGSAGVVSADGADSVSRL